MYRFIDAEGRRLIRQKDVPADVKRHIIHQARYLAGLEAELLNSREISESFHPQPGDVPVLEGIDLYGKTIGLADISQRAKTLPATGGDHLIWVAFKQRYNLDQRIKRAKEKLAEGELLQEQVIDNLFLNYHRAGILIADVTGHQQTDAHLNHILHQAFMVGADYEIDHKGEITTNLLEKINSRFFRTSALTVQPEGSNTIGKIKAITMIYGEIWEGGKFRYISCGHPYPVAFSHDKETLTEVVKETSISLGLQLSHDDIDKSNIWSPLGLKPAYITNEMQLEMPGDILLLYTDGFSEPDNTQPPFLGEPARQALIKLKDRNAKDIHYHLIQELLAYTASPADDITLIVIKRTK
ncbi:MAG: PP2C family protein-serine/threonine phosphatase [Nanoarchaeota archaeon]